MLIFQGLYIYFKLPYRIDFIYEDAERAAKILSKV